MRSGLDCIHGGAHRGGHDGVEAQPEFKRRPLPAFPPLTRTRLPISFRQGGQ